MGSKSTRKTVAGRGDDMVGDFRKKVLCQSQCLCQCNVISSSCRAVRVFVILSHTHHTPAITVCMQFPFLFPHSLTDYLILLLFCCRRFFLFYPSCFLLSFAHSLQSGCRMNVTELFSIWYPLSVCLPVSRTFLQPVRPSLSSARMFCHSCCLRCCSCLLTMMWIELHVRQAASSLLRIPFP